MFLTHSAELNAPSLHPSLPPCRAPAQLLGAGPTEPRQQGPTATACAGDKGHPLHTTAADAVRSCNSCSGSCCCISYSKSSSKVKAQAWAGQSATSAQLSSDPGLSVFPRGLCSGSTAAHTHTISSDPLCCTNKRLHSTAFQYTLTVLISPCPHLYFKFLKNILLQKERAALSLLHATALPREGGTFTMTAQL